MLSERLLTSFTSHVVDGGGWLPVEWLTYVKGGGATAICTGVMGGCDVDVLREYADRALFVLDHPDNISIWRQTDIGIAHQILVEQYYLAAFAADMTRRLDHLLDVRYLFTSMSEAFDPVRTRDVGFTHLIAAAKLNPHYENLVAERVLRDYPGFYAKCI